MERASEVFGSVGKMSRFETRGGEFIIVLLEEDTGPPLVRPSPGRTAKDQFSPLDV